MNFTSISFFSLIDCRMKEKIKTGISVLIILILLPYVASVFRTGSLSGVEAEVPEPDLEVFVAEILPTQMPVTYEEEALKAQAVIVRTNLLRQAMSFYEIGDLNETAEAVQESDLETMGFSFYSREEQLELWGFENQERYAEKCRQAPKDTAWQILTLERKLVDLPYHAVSAGWSRTGAVLGGEYSYLESVECSGDLQSSDYLKIQIIELEEVPEILARDEAGYVLEIRMGGEIYGGEEFRSIYGLNSSCITADQTEGGIRITTKGLGHGLGMSMYQANLQALSGMEYQEILQYFYPQFTIPSNV